MVAEATNKHKRLRETIAFGDFPAQPVGLPTQKFSLSVDGAKKHQQEDTKEKGAGFSGGFNAPQEQGSS